MPRPRLPQLKAEVSGAAIKDPQRFRGRKAPTVARALGAPPKSMSVEQREAWENFRAELPWLNGSHRALLRMACLLRARVEGDDDIGVNALATYSAVLSKLAATPVDETKVSFGDEREPEPEARYFN